MLHQEKEAVYFFQLIVIQFSHLYFSTSQYSHKSNDSQFGKQARQASAVSFDEFAESGPRRKVCKIKTGGVLRCIISSPDMNFLII